MDYTPPGESSAGSAEPPRERSGWRQRAPAPVVIEALNVSKTFNLPSHRVDSIKERIVHPFAQGEFTELRALDDVSFDIHRGEFFGIVGRNGSGKSTLLKVLAGIYSADGGSIRMAGSLAPFIELGVGFNTDLTARENIVLNGVMMGLSRSQAEQRIEAVLNFAELEDFVELKLKNYSSGMLVRLAFSVMLESEADILLFDEVLAVGDAAFQQKCANVFTEMRDSEQTVILVTHDMRAVEKYCHRAMLLNEGQAEAIGEPDEVTRLYLKRNFEGSMAESIDPERSPGEYRRDQSEVRLVKIWLETSDREPVLNVEQGEEMRFNVVLDAAGDISGVSFGFMFSDANGVDVFGLGRSLAEVGIDPDTLRRGQRVHFVAALTNRLAVGHYYVSCWVYRDNSLTQVALHVPDALDFVVYGRASVAGLVNLEHEISLTIEDGAPK